MMASTSDNQTAAISASPDYENIDVKIQNVVCDFLVPLHIDLKKLTANSWDCEYDRFQSVLVKQLRNPECRARIYNSGKVCIVGCKSEADSQRAARIIGRKIQRIMGKIDERVALKKFRINNILACCRLPFGISLHELARKYPKETYYEQELSVGLLWTMVEPKATLRIHTTGTIVVIGATSENNVLIAIEKIYGYVKDVKIDLSKLPMSHPYSRKRQRNGDYPKRGAKRTRKSKVVDDEEDLSEADDYLLFDEEYDLYD